MTVSAWIRSRGSNQTPGCHLAESDRKCLIYTSSIAHVSPFRYPYMALLCALLAGDNRSVDALSATLASLSVPSVLSTIEDFMWCKLTLVAGAVASAAQVRVRGTAVLKGKGLCYLLILPGGYQYSGGRLLYPCIQAGPCRPCLTPPDHRPVHRSRPMAAASAAAGSSPRTR